MDRAGLGGSVRRTDPAFEYALQEAMPKKEPWGLGVSSTRAPIAAPSLR
jgi:hypothetical protein